MKQHELVQWFRQSSPYINLHRQTTVVINLRSEVISHDHFRGFLHDLAIAHNLGVKIVMVLGARQAIDKVLQQQGIASEFHLGKRLTSNELMEVIAAEVGRLRNYVEAKLSMGLINSPMHQANITVVSGNFVVAKPLGVVDGIDYLHTGELRKINAPAIKQQLDSGNIVLISPIGHSPSGESFNLEADDLAVQLASSLKAEKLVSVYDQVPTSISSSLSIAEAEQLATDQTITHELAQLISSLSRAVGLGVERAHLVDINIDGSLLSELYTRDGQGVMISSCPDWIIRAARVDDLNAIINLIRPLEQSGALVRRSRERLEVELPYFTLVEKDGMIISCCALYPFEDQSAEIACVATAPEYRGTGVTIQLLKHIEIEAKKAQLKRLFLLTTGSMHWFLEQGFSPSQLDDLPASRRDMYNYQRNSKLMAKTL
ncbi:amino-acid N-acetyltransferase [Umboniibacter marinipuniceus]|uniref:Amino-acid acetyltransferase n=1 Tax=Umboniibacter marinipuniceus TaxID=569599 RepID=A0A3M0A5Z4_9GAMM|nr:amino-acid N-acetyltransferase [Umboniibacter marinipuniceus]RMA80200.1 N-acetylglutamate synthase [Umboniibacter marinipuniceus]